MGSKICYHAPFWFKWQGEIKTLCNLQVCTSALSKTAAILVRKDGDTCFKCHYFYGKNTFSIICRKIGGVIKNIKVAPPPFHNGEKHCYLPQKPLKFYNMFGRVMILISQSNQNSGSGR